MPRKLRIMSGKEAVKILEQYGFMVTRTKGSHARLTLKMAHREAVRISIPLHPELKRGTLRGIVSELEKHISSENLENDFYNQ